MNPINERKSAMNRKNTPADPFGPQGSTVNEHFAAMDAKAGEAKPPAKLSKLAAAMQIINGNISEIEALGKDVDALHTKYAPNTVWDLDTKDGAKECDLARKESRAVRLKIQNLRDQGKDLLNSLKGELVDAALADIARAQAIEDNARAQIDAKARKEQDRIDRHELKIRAIAQMAEGIATMTSGEISKRIEALTAIIVDDSYEEYMAKAQRKHREVAEVLAEASFVAAAREQAQAEADERAERERKELAALQAKETERETERGRVKVLIDKIKNLPAQVEGTDLANVREVLRIHLTEVPTAEVFGEHLELAELQHFKTTKLLEEAAWQMGMAEDKEAEDALIEARGKETGMGGTQWTEEEKATIAARGPQPLVFNTIPARTVDVFEPLDPKPAAGDEPIDDEKERRFPIRTVAAQQALSEPQATPAPAPRPRGVPVVPGAPLVATPEGDRGPAFTPGTPPAMGAPGLEFEQGTPGTLHDDPRAGLDMTESEVPDLLKAAQDAVHEFFDNSYQQDGGVPAALYSAMERLRAAVDFTTEFAD